MFADAARLLLVSVAVVAIKFGALVPIVVTSGLVSAINALFGQTFRTWIPSIVSTSKLRETSGLYQTGNTVAQVIAVAAGFFAFHWSEITPPLVFDICTFGLSLLMLHLYSDAPRQTHRGTHPPKIPPKLLLLRICSWKLWRSDDGLLCASSFLY